jgi:hypothetical protein
MKKFLFSIIALAALSQNVVAAHIAPQFNLTGTWNFIGHCCYTNAFQEGTEVTYIDITTGADLYYVGRYITPSKVEGIGHLTNRATNCKVDLRIIITATDANSFATSEHVLYANCGLTAGQIITNSATRIY